MKINEHKWTQVKISETQIKINELLMNLYQHIAKYIWVFDDFTRKNDQNQGKWRKSQEKTQENGKTYIRNEKLRPGQPGTGGRAGPVDFGPRKKIRLFHLVTQGRNPMSEFRRASYRPVYILLRIPAWRPGAVLMGPGWKLAW